MIKLYLIREYGIINMSNTVIVDCYVSHKVPDNAIPDVDSDSLEFERSLSKILSRQDIARTFEDISDYMLDNDIDC